MRKMPIPFAVAMALAGVAIVAHAQRSTTSQSLPSLVRHGRFELALNGMTGVCSLNGSTAWRRAHRAVARARPRLEACIPRGTAHELTFDVTEAGAISVSSTNDSQVAMCVARAMPRFNPRTSPIRGACTLRIRVSSR